MFKQAETFADGIVPQLIMEVLDTKLGLIGRVVIDSTVNNRSLGGLRIMPTITLEELVCLARNMTLKLGFWGIPMGGAKSCVFAGETFSRERRHNLLAGFGRILAPMLKSGVYLPADDMGSTIADVETVLTSAGTLARRTKTDEARERERVVARYTSWTMLASAKLAAAHIGLDLSGSSIAVEGFGKIGSAAALTFADAGAKVVAISTIRGGVYDAAGLDVSRLLELSEEVGDDVVNRYPARRISSNEVIGLNVDILLPCNGAWTINRANVHSVRSKIICPGANIPFTNEVEQILHEKRIFCVPDIVANSGAVFGGHVDSFFSQQRIQDTINGEVCSRLAEIIRRAEEEGVTLGRVATEMCLQKFNSVKRRAGQRSLFQNRFVKSSAKMLPRRIKNLLAPIYLKRVLSPN